MGGLQQLISEAGLELEGLKEVGRTQTSSELEILKQRLSIPFWKDCVPLKAPSLAREGHKHSL